MKKLLIAAVAGVGLLLSLPSMAQTGVRFGIKAGANLNFPSVKYGNISVSGDSRFGFFGGGLLEISPNTPKNKFKIQLEALYNRVNMQYSGADTLGYSKARINVNQISVPLVAKYFILPQLSINVGPTFNFNLNATGSMAGADGKFVDAGDADGLKTFQLGLAAGASYYLYKGLFLDARYTPLFGSLNDDASGEKVKVSAVQLGIGYKF